MTKQKQDIEKLSFEQTIKDLEQIVAQIESGQTPLEESINQYEFGMKMIKHCRNILQHAEEKIKMIGEQANEPQAESKKSDDGDELF